MYVNRENELETNMVEVYGLVRGQCSHSVKAVLKREGNYDDKDESQDVLWRYNPCHLVRITRVTRDAISLMHCWPSSQCVRAKRK